MVALIGLIDGSDVLGVIPVNGADNVLHIALSALGILTALMSRGDDDRGRSDTPVVEHRPDRVRDGRLERNLVDHGSTRDAADRVRP